ncbi:MAG: alpha/beta fold hydrolase, partial [Phycisphaerae bacterium]
MLIALLLGTTGCFSEASITMHGKEAVRLAEWRVASGWRPTVREWLASAHAELSPLLPRSSHAALLTEELVTPNGAPRDAFAAFGVVSDQLQSVFGNLNGLSCTAKSASRRPWIDETPPAWPGFEDVWIPIGAEVSLSGRLGLARRADGEFRRADCIVILPGFFGDNGVLRSRDLSLALLDAGYHVLSLEMRACGQTEARYPGMPWACGVFDCPDLMAVSDWLERRPEVERTGLVGFCWGSTVALLTAWYDGCAPDDPSISPSIAGLLSPPAPSRLRFRAGILAFSPVLRFETLMDELDVERSAISDPVFAGLQDTIRQRMTRKRFTSISGSLRALIDYEYESYGIPLPDG